MSIRLVTYSTEDKLKVESFNKLDKADKVGSYWDRTDDNDLQKVKKNIKDFYIKTQGHTCPYCRQTMHVNHNGMWDAEHIIPKDKHPNFMFEPLNLCVSCKDCNQEKHNKNVLKNPKRVTFPKYSKDYIFIHPHLDIYQSHIKILTSSLFFIPLDDKGKATIEICGLLRFLYKFTDYGNVPLEIKTRIGQLHQELSNAKTSIEENFILSCIGDVVEHGKKLAQEAHINKLGATVSA
ncbi:HNH endonuclease [Aeromonas hydrophila]|uniref:HNH endonuclease n=1 Tax=Aeromonas hydrophila TaxID=644 RepID=UPI002B478145|nr:HNH endonuclease [Aeromonas hydrophila]